MPGSGLAVLADGGFTLTNRVTINAALERHRVPSIASYRQFASDGALMSYGTDTIDIYSRAANYVDRILKVPSQPTCRYNSRSNSSSYSIQDREGTRADIPPKLLALPTR